MPDHDQARAVAMLLTQAPEESYELYALRIAHAPGTAGRLARAAKRAALEEHLERVRGARSTGAPPYAWALVHIAHAQERRGEPWHDVYDRRSGGASKA